ncbi:aldo/keto reductase [Arenicella xantha]|uniref:Aryl-alcohol dehydrogenase-like predicted oxidoreductase n=1 Tax=Arenicella xantha TaxID=644221 RepID=A0A395JPX3_9GAMM|nr:aldo/keto reductase [Arenicella xantha]RBP53659.1 aryl-alcohol dehydrogenase-like predicted oxidoreductase [Arenicella xantha]
MKTRLLGTQGLEVSSIGLGCMGMSDFYGRHNEQDSLNTLSQAIESGVTFWDTSDIYGPHTNEQLLGRYFTQHPSHRNTVTLATKFGVMRSPQGDFLGVNGRPEYVQQACDASLTRLGVEHIDLYYQHRMDPSVPIEDTVGAMADLVKQGKVKYLGLSEAGVNTLERASVVHPISALQSEFSLWSRHLEAEILPACQRLGVGLVSYSPLGRGFLTGAIKTRADLEAGDWRLANPRFSEQNFHHNLALVDKIKQQASAKQCTAAQLALAWILHQSDHYVPIPGTRSVQRLVENAGAVSIELSTAELDEVNQIISPELIAGERYPEAAMSALDL